MSTADAVAREAEWLQSSGDTLPALLLADGGPWKIVQAYWPGARFAAQQTGIYVTRRILDDQRSHDLMLMPQYEFTLKLVWPVRTSAPPIAETEQQNLDNAVDLLIQRIRGLPGDKSHGGRFLSVGEAPKGLFPSVAFEDPEVTMPVDKVLRASATYRADDFEVYG